MNASREDIEKMDAYLANQLDDEARLLFDSKLATDEVFAEEFELHKMITAGIAAEKEARLRAILDEQRQETFIGANTWGKKFTLASAAVVLLGLIIVFYGTYRVNNPSKGIAKTENIEDSKNVAEPPTIMKDITVTDQKEKSSLVEDKGDDAELIEIEENQNSENDLLAEDDSEDEKRFANVAEEEIKQLDDAAPEPKAPARADAETIADIDEERISKDKYLQKELVAVNYRYVKSTPATQLQNTNLDVVTTASTRNSRKKSTGKEASVDKAKAPVDSAKREFKEKVRVEADSSNKKGEKISIAYYSSPLNYKGYTYNKRTKKIVVYGLSKTKSSLIKYNEALYLQNGSTYYLMVPTSTYLRLNKVTNTQLISILNQ